ncbi:MAG: GMC family oxidoreductase N-terminal domain-containing protein [Myxococcota bacterium]
MMTDLQLANVLEGHQVTASRTETVDVVIIGSGCGGAVVGKELARAGKSVLMLERGGLSLPQRGDFDQREDDMFARLDGGRGLDTSENGQAALTYGRTVGGASVHYWADTWRAPEDRLKKWNLEHHQLADLLPWFERIEKDLHAHPAHELKRNAMNRLYVKGAEAAGIEWEPVTQARDDRCIGSGYCMQGCAYDGKQSQLVTSIPEALSLGLKLFADCEVRSIDVENGRAVGVTAHFLERRTGRPSGHTLTVKAKKVVVAAGGFNSAPLLMRSRIPDPSGQLGKNLQFNPCPQLFALFDEDVAMWRGIPAAVGTLEYRLHRFDGARYVEGGYLLHPNQLPPATLAALLPGFGASHRQLMEKAHRIGSAIAWIDDANSGSVTLDPEGEPLFRWELSGLDELTVRDAFKKQATVLLHAGAREVIVPDARGTRLSDLKELKVLDTVDLRPGSVTFATPHPAGMCRMGADPKTSVVDVNHECHAVKGLFVCDPSVFPTAVSVDPSETIMAFSYVAAARMLERW